MSQLKLDSFARRPKKPTLNEIIERFYNSSLFVEAEIGPCDMCGEIRKLRVHIVLRAKGSFFGWEDLFICAKCALSLPSKLKPCGDELLKALLDEGG